MRAATTVNPLLSAGGGQPRAGPGARPTAERCAGRGGRPPGGAILGALLLAAGRCRGGAAVAMATCGLLAAGRGRCGRGETESGGLGPRLGGTRRRAAPARIPAPFEALERPGPSMAENFDRAPGAGRGRGRGSSVLAGASESCGGACPGGGGSHGPGAVDQQQNKTSGFLPQQEPLRPPRTAPLGTGSAGTGPPRRATGPRPRPRRRGSREPSPVGPRSPLFPVPPRPGLPPPRCSARLGQQNGAA